MVKASRNIWDFQESLEFDAMVGHRVRQSRLTAGMTCDDLAEAAGISLEDVVAIESGREKAQASTLLKIAKVLNVPFLTFFGTL